jgi:hypothetical protein
MRDINPAERLLSLFTSPDSAAGIAGDLSEERVQRGSVWFWRQVVGTAFALCRGAWFASPGSVLLLVLLGMVLTGGLAFGQAYLWRFNFWNFGALSAIFIHQLINYSGALFTGAVLVAAAPKLGMAACVLLAVVSDLLWVSIILDTYINFPHVGWAPYRSLIIGLFFSPIILCLGGAIVRRRWTLRHLPKAA